MHLLLVDGSTFIFRAFHALPPLSRKSDDLPVGAVAGFCNMLFKLMEDLKGKDAPTHMAVVFDYSGKSFRNEFYPEYKAHRPPAPEDLVPQFPLTRAATRAFSILSVEQEGFEADDIIATYTERALKKGARVTIVSTDKDLMQLIDGNDGQVRLLDTLKNKWIGPEEVAEKFGVGPQKVIEVQALAGDSVDNVPGVPGIGIKTAAELIGTYGDLETLLAHASDITQPKRRENLIEFADQARVSKRLVTLKTDVPLEHDLSELKRQEIDAKTLIPFLKALEFNTFLRRIAKLIDADPDQFEADPALAATEGAADGAESVRTDLKAPAGAMTPAAHAEAEAARVKALRIDRSQYETIRDEKALESWLETIRYQGFVAVDTETTGLDNQSADLVGVCLATAPNKACYIPLGHRDGEGDLLGGGGLVEGQLDLKKTLKSLKGVLEAPGILKILQNAKFDMGILARYGIELAPFDDTMLIAYALDGARDNGMDALSEKWLGHTPIAFKELAGTGKSQKTFDLLAIDDAAEYAAEDADITLRLWLALKPRLTAEKMTTVYETLERPLCPVLARMERRGVSVDRKILSRLSGDFAQRAAAIESEIYELAGETFNIGSPAQLGEILFSKLGLDGGKKTKTGAWSTDARTLETLAAQAATGENHSRGAELAARVVDWRGLTKLKSTYTDALPEYINPETHRVHTSYSQAAVLTGRLSSNEPNLQNIPIRTEDGRKIRTAFVAEKGRKLVSADYSQIELRLLAHIADIPALKQAFADGLDIHAMTASEMFTVPLKEMTPEVRRRAKAINFGIIYGISAFGLAAQLSIPRSEAADFIKAYFKKFPGIEDYMARQRETVHKQGFVETLFGRKIWFSNPNTSHPAERAFIERASINAPLQGTAADIIRRAMVHMEPALKKKRVSADMLLQVHDELIFEIDEAEVKKAVPVITETMERAAEPAVTLSVPIKVDSNEGKSWEEAH